jgi:enoyl-CoA hydratase/3-hydroxyacyl-CoA dehydrogenase
VDETCKKMLRIGMGPFMLMNVTGVPIAFHTTSSLGEQINDFYATCDTLKEQFDKKEDWNMEGEVEEDKTAIVEERLLGMFFTIACHLVEEGVASIEDTDRGAKIGLAWSKGPFELMNLNGIEKSYEMVEKFVQRYPQLHMPESLKAQFEKKQPWDFSFVDLRVKDGIATILFNRPEAMNAINETVMNQLNDRFTKAEQDPSVKAIVLEGAGKAFVAGADIGYFIKKIQADSIDDIVKFTAFGHEVLSKIDNSEKLVICKLDGLALGGGAEIAFSADTIIATEKGSIGLPETGIGIFPGLGGTQRPTRYIGKELAKYLVFTGRNLSPKDALEIGLVEYVVPSTEVDAKIKELVASGNVTTKANKGEVQLSEKYSALKNYFENANLEKLLAKDESLDEEGQKLAKTIGFKAPVAIKLANQIMDEGAEMELADGLKKELESLPKIFSSKDALEGLKSVIERRRPTYTGE